ncbi:hypothetical protein MKK70_27290 [Methylobacterium sp. E-041]|uniref:hypothetical protein n=1 Tax=Methylobacterium sp. E-041 TaxID=2836573 RepID=UPI001FB9F736|nr:hypothetical protein [Methylobacterium sp. E-041]MCJ2109006.1 hypothetical protein [Methylobacterium sp. E-041]
MTLLGACALFGLTVAAKAEPAPATPNVPATFKPSQCDGYFFVGDRHETIEQNELASGQMFVQFPDASEVQQLFSVLPVHDGWGSSFRVHA